MVRQNQWIFRAGKAFLFLLLLCLVFPAARSLAASSPAVPEFWVSPDGTLTADAMGVCKTDNGKRYMLLPSAVNPADLCFGVAEGVTLYINGKQVQTGDSAAVLAKGDLSARIGKRKFTLNVMTGSPNLPVLFITTESGSLKKVESNKENREAGKLIFMGPEGDIQYKGDLEHIKIRGNSSTKFMKKNYQIKLSSGASLMGMGKAKKWILTSNSRDKSHLRNLIMMDMAEAVGLPYTPQHTPAEVYINHQYRGLYLFSEKIEIDDDRISIANLEKAMKEINEAALDSFKRTGSRSSVPGKFKAYQIENDPEDITGGYLMEYESYGSRYVGEASAYTTKKGNILVVKSPEYASVAEMQYITGIMQSFENAINAGDGVDPATGKHYTEIADAESLALKYMIEELSENYDGNSSSQFFFKPADSVSEKFFSGPVWDYDSSFGTYAQKHNARKVLNPSCLWIGNGEWTGWYPTLWRRADFKAQVAELWNSRMKPCVEVLLGSRSAGEETGVLRSIAAYAEEISASVAMDRIKWPRVLQPAEDAIAWTGGTFQQNIDFLQDFLQRHSDYLDTVWVAPEAQ